MSGSATFNYSGQIVSYTAPAPIPASRQREVPAGSAAAVPTVGR